MCRTGWFATLWHEMAERLGLEPRIIETDWRRGADVDAIGEALAKDAAHRIKAVCVVHNETSTGCASRIDEVRAAIDAAGHPALLMVDTISSLASMDYRHDEWGVDVTVAGSQKGLMLPPGLSFNAISAKARAASKNARMRRAYWDWADMLASNATGYFPYTPSTNLLYGLQEAIDMLFEEGLDAVFARHLRLAEATRRAARGWGLDILCADPAEYSAALTAIVARMEQHVDDPASYFKCNWELHRRIAAISSNAPLRSIYLTLTEGLESMLDDSEIDEFDGLASIAIHRELVAAIEGGPGARLEAALEAHTPLPPPGRA